MRFEPGKYGQRIIITEDCGIKGWKGTVQQQVYTDGQERVYCYWENGSHGWMPPKSMSLISNFREGDVIEIDGDRLTVDETIPFDESQATLIARKYLI